MGRLSRKDGEAKGATPANEGHMEIKPILCCVVALVVSRVFCVSTRWMFVVCDEFAKFNEHRIVFGFELSAFE